MALDNESFNKQLYDLLKVRGYKPVPKNSRNQNVEASQLADVMEFVFMKDGEEYGKAWASIDDASNVIIYYDDEQADSPEGNTPGVEYDDSWSGFLKHVKNWAQRKQLSFELANKDRLSDDMRQREYVKMKEKISEGYHAMGKKASYNDNVPNVKIILQHNRQIEEGEQRYRNVAKIFLENTEGERILAPTTRPGIAQIYARHLAEGGVPNDERWNHIKGLCEEYSKMAGFVRATRNNQFNESAQALVNEGINHYNTLRESLSKMRGHRGYNAYFESWTPSLMEEENDDSINELFVQETVDPRIESVMPILSRLSKKSGNKPMTEVSELAEWAQSILEGGDGGEASEEEDVYTDADAGHEMDASAEEESLEEGFGSVDAFKNKLSRSNDPFEMIYNAIAGDYGDEIRMAFQEMYDDVVNDSGYRLHPDDDFEKIINTIVDQLVDDMNEEDSTTKTLAVPADKMLEAPGAETLGHNQSTEKSNLAAFDLDEAGAKVTSPKWQANRRLEIDIENMADFEFKQKYGHSKQEMKSKLIKEEASEGRPYICLHVKKGRFECHANSTYEAAKKAAQKWGMKNTSGIDVYLADVSHSPASIGEALDPIADKIAELEKQLKTATPQEAQKIKEILTLLKAKANRGSSSKSSDGGTAADRAEKRAKDRFSTKSSSSPGISNTDNLRLMLGLAGLAEENTNESRMAEADSIIQDIINGDLDAYDVMTNPRTPEEEYVANMIQEMYDEVSIDYHLHPDDDFEKILDIVVDQLEKDYGNVDEGLDANQKRAGQLGPTEKVGPKGAVGKLVGANESIEVKEGQDDLDALKRLLNR